MPPRFLAQSLDPSTLLVVFAVVAFSFLLLLVKRDRRCPSNEILAKKGQGLAEVVRACGDAQSAFQMSMLEHLDHLAETAAKAISNIEIDKIVVWDPGSNGDGKSVTRTSWEASHARCRRCFT
jgi:uncharacterized membrane protein YqiK